MLTFENVEPGQNWPYVFYFGPFRFHSVIDIPQLRRSCGSGQFIVVIRLVGTPDQINGGKPFGECCQVSPTEALLDIPGVARYHVCDGHRVDIEMAASASLGDVCTYLLGSVFGVLCHQNGLLPLHASSIEHDGTVTAFLGNSGAGKSTLAACLRSRGHRVTSDDICLLQPEAAEMRVVPLAPWLKLWSKSLAHLGEVPHAENRVVTDEEKYRLPLPDPGTQSLRLRRVVLLAKGSDPQAEPSLKQVRGVSAITSLMDMTYVGWVAELAGLQPFIFKQYSRLIQQVETYQLTMPWGLERMDSVLDLIEFGLLPISRSDQGDTV